MTPSIELHRVEHHTYLPYGIAVRDISIQISIDSRTYLHKCMCNNTHIHLLIFRDRMLASALNFAIGFFGYPFERQYQQSITIEAKDVRISSPVALLLQR
jgi:hypothetical protein